MEKIKIDIISGFLGAGKTTFIRKMMQDLFLKEKVVILENEFGRINIDEETLGRAGLTVKPIQAGCICCSGSMDLTKGIYEIIREYNPNRIIVEPTGIAKLSEIIKLLKTDEIIQSCKTEHIVTIVDAKNYYVRTMISKNFFEDQIRSSKVIFLSKTGQMAKDKIADVKEAINKIEPDCLVVDEKWECIEPVRLKAFMEYKPDNAEIKDKSGMRINYQNDFDSYEVVTEDNISVSKIKRFLSNIEKGIFGEIHRIKGFCKSTENEWYSIDYIPGETIIKPLSDDCLKSNRSKLCLIGRQLDKDKLKETFLHERKLAAGDDLNTVEVQYQSPNASVN